MSTTTLDATIATILSGFDIDVADAISGQAAHSARELRAQGWQGGGSAYRISVYTGDAEALEGLLGRAPSVAEIEALARCIRAHLDATA